MHGRIFEMADVILRINGKDVNGSEKAFTTYAKLGDTSPIDVELERNNIPKTYRFILNEH